MSDPDGPVASPEQPEPAQTAPAQPAAPAVAAPSAAVPPAAVPPTQVAPPPAPVPPAPRRGTGFTVLVAGVTSLVVALVVAAGTAFTVARHVDNQPHRVMIGVENSVPDGVRCPDMHGWSDQRPGQGTDESGSTDSQNRRGPKTDSQGSSSGEQGPTDTESSSS